jgi:flagellar biogenesis protein FliO
LLPWENDLEEARALSSGPSSREIGEDTMPLVTVVITLVVVGLLLWLVNRFIPMQGQIKGILNGIVVIAVILWLLKIAGLLDVLSQFHVGQDMPLFTILITLGVIGVLLWLVNRFIPMQGQIKGILNGVVVIAVVLWLMKIFGLFVYLNQFKVGH